MRPEKMAPLATPSSVSKVPAHGRFTDTDTHTAHTHTPCLNKYTVYLDVEFLDM